MRHSHQADIARYADRKSAGDRLTKGQWLTIRSQKALRIGIFRCGFAAIDCGNLIGRAIIINQEPAAADPARLRLKTSIIAIAASAAEPPSRSISMPASVARGSALLVTFLSCAAAIWATAHAANANAVRNNFFMRTLLWRRRKGASPNLGLSHMASNHLFRAETQREQRPQRS
jgi:hypothetical protein